MSHKKKNSYSPFRSTSKPNLNFLQQPKFQVHRKPVSIPISTEKEQMMPPCMSTNVQQRVWKSPVNNIFDPLEVRRGLFLETSQYIKNFGKQLKKQISFCFPCIEQCEPTSPQKTFILETETERKQEWKLNYSFKIKWIEDPTSTMEQIEKVVPIEAYISQTSLLNALINIYEQFGKVIRIEEQRIEKENGNIFVKAVILMKRFFFSSQYSFICKFKNFNRAYLLIRKGNIEIQWPNQIPTSFMDAVNAIRIKGYKVWLTTDLKKGAQITFFGLSNMNREECLDFINRENQELLREARIVYFDEKFGMITIAL